jgi:regulation of enolase protein 1 (concanavalin A-like superfamily)
VRHLSINAEGTRVYASRFITPPLPGESTANVVTAGQGGEVVVLDANAALLSTVRLQHSDKPDGSLMGRGLPNYLGAPVISPDGLSAWVPSKQDNIKRGLLRDGQALNHESTVRAIASRIVLATSAEDYAARVDFDNAGLPSALAFDPWGIFAFTALEGSRAIAVIDVWNKREIVRFTAGRAPQGVLVSPDGRTLWTQNFMDRTLSVHNIGALIDGNEVPATLIATLPTITTERLAANVLLGKQLFYDSRDNRLALQEYISCAGCHNDGDGDGRTWDFTGFGEGLRNTISLRGHGAHGALHWTGNFDEVQDFENQIVGFAGGTGLIGAAAHPPLGAPNAGRSADLDALAAYVKSLVQAGSSPARSSSTLPAAAAAGRAVFKSQNCAACHAGANFTNSATGVFANVGTIKPTSGQRLGQPLTGFDVPTLRGLFNTAPYLHDGSAATLAAAVQAHQGVSLNATDLANLVAFLDNIDDEIVSAPAPLTLTLTSPAGTVSGPFTVTATFSGVATGFALNDIAVTNGTASALTGSGANYSFTVTPGAAGVVMVAVAAGRAEDGDGDGNLASNTVAVNYLPPNVPPAISLVSPTSGAIFTAPATINFVANASDSDGSVAKVEFFAGATKLGEDTSAPFTFAWSAVAAGGYALSARATDNSGATASSELVNVLVREPGVPSGWSSQDVGAVGRAGGANFVDGVFTVQTSGEDIWWNADQFHFVSQPWLGDGTIVARVASISQTNVWALGGVMFRESLAANSRNVLMDVHSAMGHGFQWRETTGGPSAWIDGPNFNPPRWVKLQRTGNVFTGSMSADGVNWTVVGTRTVAMGSACYVGLAACASNNAALSTVVFTDVALSSPVPNQPPVVSLAANGGPFTAPATVQLEATANDIDGSVARVEFFNGTTKLGEDTTAPFAFTWTNVGAGTHAVTARVTDNLGATTTSAVVSVTVAPPPNVPPTVSLVANGGPWNAPATVNLTATASDSDGSVVRVEFFNGATKLGEATGAPYTLAWSGVAAGNYTLTAVATDNASAATTSAPVNITVSPAGTLPPGWVSADIGTTGAPGSATQSGGNYTVSGAGAAVGGTSDAFQFAAQEWTGDGEMIVRLAALDAVSAAAQAGVMFRETTAAGARHVFLHLTAGNGAALSSRGTPGGTTASVPGAGITPPRWLRLVRSGSTFTGYLSLDGTGWTQLGTVTVGMNASVQAGLAVCSRQAGVLATASFGSFVLRALPPIPQPPVVAITAPANGATFTAPANIIVEMDASDPDGTVAKVELFAGDTKVGEDTAAPFAFAWNGVPAGQYTLTARATDNTGLTADSAPISLSVSVSPGGLPVPWVAQDIGAVGRPGDTTFSSGAFTVKGSGEDIYWTADQFRYVWQPWTGNGTITARVASVGQTNVWALGGVMFRESLAANSRNVLMDVHAAMGHGFQWRQNNGGGSSWIDGPDFAPPRWVRLTRNGNTFTGSMSADGVTWTVVGTREVAMPATIYVGLAVCASNNATTTTVVFEQVTVVP